MVKTLLTKVFGSRHERERKRVQPIVDEINDHGERLQSLSEAELQGQTAKFRAILHERTDEIERRIADLKEQKRIAKDPAERESIDSELGGADGRGGLEGKLREVLRDALDEILPEAFATVREAARRLLGTTAPWAHR
jgi:preprotein translocase subunit SecA